jgi:hypothetical protein
MFVSRIEDQLMDRLLAEVLSYLRTCVVRAKLSLVNVFLKDLTEDCRIAFAAQVCV